MCSKVKKDAKDETVGTVRHRDSGLVQRKVAILFDAKLCVKSLSICSNKSIITKLSDGWFDLVHPKKFSTTMIQPISLS
jgi:hypothetical protein